jgi:putative nucleotidyltransferase with HDIG domain
MLGVHTLKDIVTSVGIIGHFSSKLKNGFNHTLFWQHAIGTGITARVLARSCDIDQDVAFTAGLLHDIGKLVLDVHFPDEFACVLARRDSDNCLLREAETLVLGFDHTVVGAKVAQQWKLPAAIQEVILYHHDYEQLRSKPLVNLIHISDIVCRGLEIGNGGDSLIPALEPEALDRLGLDWNILQAYLPQIEEMNASANLLFEPNEKNVSVC